MYKCGKCKKIIKSLDEKFVRCPECGYRILFKERPPVAKEVSTD
jgi:DNA-directed RNA polymerase subunit RPC12/RpoP